MVLHVVAARARVFRAIVAAVALCLVIVAGTPVHAAGLPVAPAGLQQEADGDRVSGSGGDGGPSIIRKPTDEAGRPSNDLGFLVGLGLFAAWIGSGVVMFRRARRRAGAVRGRSPAAGR